MSIEDLRKEYHRRICKDIIRVKKDKDKKREYPNFADGSNISSSTIALGILEHLGCSKKYGTVKEQTVGDLFETITKDFIESVFALLDHVRPGRWHYSTFQTDISGYDQYEHLAYLSGIIGKDRRLSSALGGNYLVKPDIIIAREPMSDEEINRGRKLINARDRSATLTPLRSKNSTTSHQILHASISCKWTIRSDRSQNTRTEALNLIRNRKGHLPHITAVTAEPLPSRIATLALGTGDLDCVYHFALRELRDVIREIQNEDQFEMLEMMVEGRRLRDISDLPFDLAI